MSGPEDLVTDEGVDEGSAASAAESTDGDAGPDPDVLGEPPHGAPVDDAQAAAPVDMESAESRRARAEAGPGQQLQEGEG
jgi:hypothetical protein